MLARQLINTALVITFFEITDFAWFTDVLLDVEFDRI